MPADLRAAIADRYRLERELGAGGMATVYLAEDVRHRRRVAVKVLHPELSAVLGGERFLKEIELTANLQHPHILPLFDSGEAAGQLYYVMPFVEGETLRARLEREKQLPIADALLVAKEVADALQYAHEHGVIHRDIKPENILLQGGHALVADFGIALAVQQAGGMRMTQTGLSLGTPQYMAPEQAMGEKAVDARADVYALGAVTYEMLAGEPPFSGPNQQAIVARVLTEKPRPIRAIRDTVTSGTEAAVLRALAKLPADRFGTAAAFAIGLHGADDVPAARPGRARVAWRMLATTGAVAAVAVAAGWALGRRGAPIESPMSMSVLLPDTIPLEPTHFNSEGMATFAIAPDGSALVFVGKKGRTTQLHLRRTASFDIRALDGTDGAFAPFFSPRGDAVAFFAGDRLMTVSLADGHVTKVAEGIFEPFGGAWGPDGRFLLSTSRAVALELRSATGDSLRSVRCGGRCALPEWLPGGTHALTSGRGSEVRVVDLETGRTTVLRRWNAASDEEAVRGSMARYDGDGHLVLVNPNGDIVAYPFDVSRVVITGNPRILAQGVRVESGRGAAQFALARDGTLAFAPGPLRAVGQVVVADRTGRLDTLATPPANYNRFDLSPDGRRILAKVTESDGTHGVLVIDATTGQVTPWVRTSRQILSAGWGPDARTAWYETDSLVFRGDPSVTTAPDSQRVTFGNSFAALADGQRYVRYARDTLLVARLDGTGSVLAIPTVSGAAGVATDDSRWYVNQELAGRAAVITARALDGSNRRLIVSNSPDFSMAWSTPGANEIIVAVNGLTTSLASGKVADEQSFWRIPYLPTASPPFGTPALLFRASVADFPGRNYGVGLRGQRFVFKQHIAAPPPREIRVMRHWHALLDRQGDGSAR